jgi:simple sugar transport system permease protein
VTNEASAVELTVRKRLHHATLHWLTSLRIRELALLPALGVAVIVGTFLSSAFLTTANIINILQQSSELSVVVIAEAMILIVGKFDLSLESTFGLAPMIGGWLIVTTASSGSGYGVNPYLGILVVLVAGAAIGAFNGILIVRYRLNAFIVTLAMLILLRGISLGLVNGQTLYDLPATFAYLGAATWAGVPVSVWLAGALYLAASLFLRYHSFGRAIYAVGGNEEAARAAGIRTGRVTFLVFVIGGVLAALAGLMQSGRIASVTSSQGQNLIFNVFAAAVIGGISLNGGRGRMVGALTGVLLLGTISNILVLSQVPIFWISASFGAVILFALTLARITSRTAQED